MSLTIWQDYATNNPCYIRNASGAYEKRAPAGIIVHSTGANNPYLKRYVNDPEHCGTNIWRNYWDSAKVQVCVHAFIGLDRNKEVGCAQLLPWDFCAWGVGSGSKGSYNYNPRYIQFEICEDGLTDATYFNAAFDKAAELCVYLCKMFNLNASNVIGHIEACQAGFGSNHGDPQNWLKNFGKDMTWFRGLVNQKLTADQPVPQPVAPKASNIDIYRVGTDWLNGRCVGQIGAFGVFENAKNACIEGYKVFNSAGAVVYTRKMEKGSRVKVINPIIYGTDRKFTVYFPEYTLYANPVGDRAVIDHNGTIVAAISTSNLQLLS